MKKEITIGEKYGPAMEITTQLDAAVYFKACVEHSMTHFGKTRKEAEDLERQNLGYYAGYYGTETRLRVEKLFLCAHPVFGKASEGTPTPEEAFVMGQEWAKK